ncbi:hypothetical protein K1719_021574 [Acacia pycnantha]|nr:hypothetical protein K1719_021574 [Acacia pycnantha]
MKPPISGDLFTTPSFLKIVDFFCVTEPTVTTSPNYNNFFNISAFIGQNGTQSQPEKSLAAMPIVTPQAPASPPPDSIRTCGILNKNGTMVDDFEVGYFDLEMVDDWVNETQVETEDSSASALLFMIKKFGLCHWNMSEYKPLRVLRLLLCSQ